MPCLRLRSVCESIVRPCASGYVPLKKYIKSDPLDRTSCRSSKIFEENFNSGNRCWKCLWIKQLVASTCAAVNSFRLSQSEVLVSKCRAPSAIGSRPPVQSPWDGFFDTTPAHVSQALDALAFCTRAQAHRRTHAQVYVYTRMHKHTSPNISIVSRINIKHYVLCFTVET